MAGSAGQLPANPVRRTLITVHRNSVTKLTLRVKSDHYRYDSMKFPSETNDHAKPAGAPKVHVKDAPHAQLPGRAHARHQEVAAVLNRALVDSHGHLQQHSDLLRMWAQ